MTSSARFLIEPILEGHFGATITPYSSKLRCPFHDDATASGWHNEYYFKCMAGCGAQGDAVRLLYMFKLDESGAIVEGDKDWRESYSRAKALAGEPDEPVSGTPVRGSRVPSRTRDYRGHSRFGTTRGGG